MMLSAEEEVKAVDTFSVNTGHLTIAVWLEKVLGGEFYCLCDLDGS